MKIQVEKPVLKSLLIMGAVVEARDAYTGGHLWRVSQFAKLLGTKLGLSQAEVIQVSLGGFLHDLGKVGVPDEILKKRATLTEHEYEVIKTHPGIGAELVREHPLAALVLDPIRHHHERANGMGYPDGLEKGAISIDARIVGLVDAFDAMTSTRPYHQGMPIADALADLEREREQEFEGELVDNFVDLGRSGALDDIVMHSDHGLPIVLCPVCGPVVAVSRTTHDGDSIICKACTGKLRLHRDGETFVSEFTGQFASAEEVQPEADIAPINDFVKQVLHEFDV